MPKITQLNEIEVSVERFLDRCSDIELYEVYLNLFKPKYHNRIAGQISGTPAEDDAERTARDRYGMSKEIPEKTKKPC